MIRLRRTDGTTLELPDITFIELCDLDGKVAQLTYQDKDGTVHVITQGEPEAEAYQKLFPQVEFTNILSL